jgi:predicted transcriptional regulator
MKEAEENLERVIIFTPADMRQLRKKAGLTQKELASRAKVSQSLIARIERGTVDPRLSTLRKILEALGSTPSIKRAKDVMNSPVATIGAQDTVRKAIEIMKQTGYSQLPVLMNGIVVGSLQEATLLERIVRSKNPEQVLNGSVYNVMSKSFPIVSPDTILKEVIDYFISHEPAVLVMKNGELQGIITKIDVISSRVVGGKN